ncbi:hypothetical protein BLNAU_14915 [Blattamonas nauphoetae]|uniref:Uncharacterized protein n=1 Tax=Blattamonas nauphoetae TaxID=2049346 RepID=A0ABQ9XC78_9EUKA|nr:hypothetical protein BLNAU_14915 [Blattamonas nauphoetae]
MLLNGVERWYFLLISSIADRTHSKQHFEKCILFWSATRRSTWTSTSLDTTSFPFSFVGLSTSVVRRSHCDLAFRSACPHYRLCPLVPSSALNLCFGGMCRAGSADPNVCGRRAAFLAHPNRVVIPSECSHSAIEDSSACPPLSHCSFLEGNASMDGE